MVLKLTKKETITCKNNSSYKLLLKRLRWVYRENFNYKKVSWREYCDTHGIYYLAKQLKDYALDDKDLLDVLKGKIFIK